MNFSEYQKLSRRTAFYPNKDNNFVYPTLGLAGEAGEVAEKIKKVLRDKSGIVDKTAKNDLVKELGDVLWYLSQIAAELGLSLDEIAEANIAKLADRQKRDRLGGSGDDR